MKISPVAKAVGACLILAPIAAASAQWVPGAEITGQSIQVETNGVVNTINFDPGGVARITTPAGRQVLARWTVANQMLCLESGANVQECWPYRSPFQAGQAVTLTSSANVTSHWVPNAVNQPPAMMSGSERG